MRFFLNIILIIFFSTFFYYKGVAQDSFLNGYLPAMELDVKLSQKGSLSFNYQQRNGVFQSPDNKFNHHYILSDITPIYSYKIGENSKVAIGGLLRYLNKEFISRTLQQIVIVKKNTKFNLDNRIRLDQTYFTVGVEHRLRYRLGVNFPLKRKNEELNEIYVKIKNEYLGSYFNSQSDLEIRLGSSFGYVLNDANKFEFGFDYRLADIITPPKEHTLWLTLGYFLELG